MFVFATAIDDHGPAPVDEAHNPSSDEVAVDRVTTDFAENRCVTGWYDYSYTRSRLGERGLNTSSAAVAVAWCAAERS
jgi:hypothetical protein